MAIAHNEMAGLPGFEPGNGGFKGRCLRPDLAITQTIPEILTNKFNYINLYIGIIKTDVEEEPRTFNS